jgi:hypothetical protein|tara:strand:+ start:1346 stop:1585 length:240 start_codon:yes stop_codon:yes gene_type:complete
MPTNNPASDFYNPPSNLSQDFEDYWFDDLEVDELFWQTNKPKEGEASIPWRKVNQTQALNLKTQKTHNFKSRTKVFQRI